MADEGECSVTGRHIAVWYTADGNLAIVQFSPEGLSMAAQLVVADRDCYAASSAAALTLTNTRIVVHWGRPYVIIPAVSLKKAIKFYVALLYFIIKKRGQ